MGNTSNSQIFSKNNIIKSHMIDIIDALKYKPILHHSSASVWACFRNTKIIEWTSTTAKVTLLQPQNPDDSFTSQHFFKQLHCSSGVHFLKAENIFKTGKCCHHTYTYFFLFQLQSPIKTVSVNQWSHDHNINYSSTGPLGFNASN